ncbi:tRNA (5-methylaminomethyl-2-thiouridine)(34)-methyltransferase MnmD [Aquicoccus sp. SCR17]|nr:tRNA (5-methylaminomethyl-2-thiouridine)(34)-methyltransferase MnmD [Carideicomes alvinocaridis]
MAEKRADLDWRDGRIPVSTRFDDPYFSLDNGLEETRHVFLAGNDLPTRFRDGFHVAELGFGTGLNFLATLQAWRQAGSPGRLRYTAFEGYPMSAAEMSRALDAFPDLPGRAALAGAWDALLEAPQEVEGVTLTLLTGDARAALPAWEGRADAWYLDGFAPAKNPELWEPALLAEVAAHMEPGGTLATYTAAGAVRRALAEAGLEVTRIAGYGRKRHMTIARKG